MDEYVTKEQVIDWFRPYGHFDKTIPFEMLVSDLDCMKAAYVVPVRQGRWVQLPLNGTHIWRCSKCETIGSPQWSYCPKCGARMNEEC